MPTSLPLFGEARPERADAAENRRKVLAAAEELFASCEPANVTMDAVAADAGVGKGTLFRRFGDRAGLARAVISEHETKLQDAMIRGEPPLGPGAPPLERLAAFGRAYVAFLEQHAALLMCRRGHLRGVSALAALYAFYRTHVGAAAARGRPGRSRRLSGRRRPRPAERHGVHVYHRGARQLSMPPSWSTLMRTSARAS